MDSATYNVQETALGRIRCGVRDSGVDFGRTSPVAMTDVSVKVAFPREGAPQLPLGQEVELSFTIDDRGPLLRAARVRSRVDSLGDRAYGFELLQTEAAREEIWRVFSSAFNMRDAFRVRPGASEPIEATVHLQEERSFAQPLVIEDISATGIAGRADVDAEDTLRRFDAARLRIKLAPEADPVELEADIVGRELIGPSVNYRFSFVRRPGPQDAGLDDVMGYIMEHQRRVAATAVH